MSSKLILLAKKAASYLLLEYRIPTYEERSQVYKHNAYMYACRRAQIDMRASFDSVGEISDSIILRFYGGKKIEIVRNEESNHYIRLPNGKFYSIDLPLFLSSEYLKKAESYEKLSRNAIRRYLGEPSEVMHFGGIFYSLDNIMFGLDGIGFQLDRIETSLDRIETLISIPESMKVLSSRQGLLEVILNTPLSLPDSSEEESKGVSPSPASSH